MFIISNLYWQWATSDSYMRLVFFSWLHFRSYSRATSEESRTSTFSNACNRAFSFSEDREACADCVCFFCGSAFGSYLLLCRLMKREIPGREIVMPCFCSMAWISRRVWRRNHAFRISFRYGVSLLWNGGVLSFPGIVVFFLKHHTIQADFRISSVVIFYL